MTIYMKRTFRNFILVLLAVFILPACSSDEKITEEMWEGLVQVVPAQDLEQEAFDGLWPDSRLKYLLARYWTYRFEGESAVIWEMEAPFFKEMFSYQTYDMTMSRTRPNQLIEIRVHGIDLQAERLVLILLELSFRGSDGRVRSTYINDRWLRFNGRWFHVEKDEFLFPT